MEKTTTEMAVHELIFNRHIELYEIPKSGFTERFVNKVAAFHWHRGQCDIHFLVTLGFFGLVQRWDKNRFRLVESEKWKDHYLTKFLTECGLEITFMPVDWPHPWLDDMIGVLAKDKVLLPKEE